MNPFYCIDNTTDRKNTTINTSRQFTVKETSLELTNSFIETAKEKTALIKKASAPIIVEVACFILSIITLICCRLISENNELNGAIFKVLGLTGILEKLPLFLAIFCALFVIGTMVYYDKRHLKVLNGKKMKELHAKDDETYKRILTELDLPESTTEVEILIFRYFDKNGKIIPFDVAKLGSCRSVVCKCYTDHNSLYMADITGKYKFDLNDLLSIKTLEKSFYYTPKHTEKAFNTESDVKKNIKIKKCHILELEHNGELWGIYFPCYELDTIEKLTGLKAED